MKQIVLALGGFIILYVLGVILLNVSFQKTPSPEVKFQVPSQTNETTASATIKPNDRNVGTGKDATPTQAFKPNLNF